MSFSDWSVKETTTGMLKITEIYLGKTKIQNSCCVCHVLPYNRQNNNTDVLNLYWMIC